MIYSGISTVDGTKERLCRLCGPWSAPFTPHLLEHSCPTCSRQRFARGICKVPITPNVHDQWTDVNDDAQFDPDIDEWVDGNDNGQFDPVWIAGFQKQRPAQGVKDDLMAVAVVIEDGDRRIGIVAVDTIGLMRKFVLDVRESVPEAWQLTTLWCATHNHEGPDTQGLWGPGLFYSGVDPQSPWSPLNATFLALLKRLLPTLSRQICLLRESPQTTHPHRRQTQAGGDR